MSLHLYVGPDSRPDKYRLVRSVGRGGEATLYLAEVTLAGQTEPVVVKVLNSDVTADESQFTELSARWSEQAELLRFINRLGVVGIREHFEGAPEHPAGGAEERTDRALYLVMNYVEGLDLRDWRSENPIDDASGRRRVLGFLEQVAQVLDVLHSGRATPSKRVVVHGDLSPGNVMVSEEGQATLVDFGLSRIAARHMTARPWFTPGYAAPEIFSGEFSPATDRYAFGAIAYFALTGEDPPPVPEQLRERFGALPLVSTADEGRRELLMGMFSTEPSERPEASAWMRTLRSMATSVPWTEPHDEPGNAGPGEALFAAAAMSGPEPSGAPDAPDTFGPKDEENGAGAGPAAEPPRGPRFSGSAPVGAGTGEHGGAAEPSREPGPDTDDAPDTGSDDSSSGSVPKRPVGGMRGHPVSEPAPVPEPPAPGPSAPDPANRPATPPRGAPSGPPPTGGPRPGPPSGPPGRPGFGPPQGQGAPSGPWPGSGPAAQSGPTHGMPAHGGAYSGTHSGPYGSGPVSQPLGTAAEPPERKSRKPLLLGIAAGAVVFMVIGGGATYVVMDRVLPTVMGTEEVDPPVDAAAPPTPSEEPRPSPTPEESASASAEEDDTADASADPSEEEPGAEERLLTQMEPVDIGAGIWEPERAELNGEVYNRVLLAADGDCHTCSMKWADYNLSRSWDTFTATLGLDDVSTSGHSVTFTVYADGEAISTETLTLGETIDIEVDVGDVLRMRLEVEFDERDIYPVWVEPTLSTD